MTMNEQNPTNLKGDSPKVAEAAEGAAYIAPDVQSISNEELGEAMNIVHAGSLINP